MKTVFTDLEAELSPKAKHALETYLIAFDNGDQNVTVGELRSMIAKLYGKSVDDELEKHFEARRNAVLPKKG